MAKYIILIIAATLMLSVLLTGCNGDNKTDAKPADFYKGQTIDLVTTGTPGGYDDLIAHVVATYLARDTGATVMVVNKRGASGMEGVNYVYSDQADGLTLGNVAAAKYVGNKIMKETAALYDIGKFSYIMSIGHELMYFFTSPGGAFQSIDDLNNAKNVKIGGSSPSGNISLAGLSVIKLLNLDARVVTGFESESDRGLAVKRGEIAGYCLNLAGARASITANLVKPLFIIATQRDPLMPDIPTITEFVKPGSDDLSLIQLWETAFVSSTLYNAPPDIPQDRLEFLRGLSGNWFQDQGFRQEINKVAGYEIKRYDTGEEVKKNMRELADNLDKFYTIFADLTARFRD
jgi:tripartite-type tricarboxylate transporter receptor subunit TctC